MIWNIKLELIISESGRAMQPKKSIDTTLLSFLFDL
jgi:hypothetical protein